MASYNKKQKEDILKSIFKRIEAGEFLRNILDEDTQITRTTFYKWVDDDPDQTERYKEVRKSREDAIFEDMINIADGKDEKTIIDEEGVKVLSNSDVQRNRLQVDTRKWILGRMNANKYGDKQTLNLGTEDEAITELNINIKKAK